MPLGIPTGTSRGNHPVDAVLLEDGRCFVVSGRCQAGILAGMAQVVFAQFGNLQGQVVFRRINMVSFTIVVYKKLHVACHLAAFQVAFQEEAFVDGFIPGWCPPFLEMFQLKRVKDIALVGCYVKRKNPG